MLLSIVSDLIYAENNYHLPNLFQHYSKLEITRLRRDISFEIFNYYNI